MTKRLEGAYRHDVLQLLDKADNLVGIELGVAGGEFSRRMVASCRFRLFFGVDMYADTHDVAQYKQALRHVGLEAPYKLLRMTFAEALDLFEDESLDFVYVDGYAHSGEEGGETIWDWARKVRIGGVLAGDDYHKDWPLVMEAVDRFAADTGFELCVTTETETGGGYSLYPSWAMVKTGPVTGQPPQDLLERGKSAAARVAAKRMTGHRLTVALKNLLPETTFERLRDWNRARKKSRKGR
ncbi:MAG: class I SAM-dependent methyltransferase [Paracoccaceae bacterium]